MTCYAITGGAKRWLIVELDVSRPPVTFASQVRAILLDKTGRGSDGRRCVAFFGELLGFVINYTPDRAIRFNPDGEPLETLSAAHMPSQGSISLGGRPVSPAVISARS